MDTADLPPMAPAPTTTDLHAFFFDGGAMGALMRAYDWAASPLGPVETWPQSLRTAINMLLTSRHPMYLIWGAEYTQFYNDAYRPILGPRKHPMALGASARETYADIWPIIAQPIGDVMATGTATWAENQLLPLERDGFVEECYFTFSYSPVRDDAGTIRGLLTVLSETTKSVIGDRRLRTLNLLGSHTAQADTAEAACVIAAQALGEQPADLPCAVIFLLEEHGTVARRVALAGLPPESALAPTLVRIRGTDVDEPWHIAEALRSKARQDVVLAADLGAIPALPWMEPIQRAVVAPIILPGSQQVVGALALGISPRLPLDAHYNNFLDLVNDHVARAIATALGHQAALARAEQAAQLDSLADMNRHMNDFLGIASHELRTPLTSITANVQMAERILGRFAIAEDAADLAKKRLTQAHTMLLSVTQQVSRLDRLVGTLLDVARIEGNRLQFDRERCDLRTIVRAAVQEQRHTAPTRTIIMELGPNDPVWINASAERIEQVVMNYVSNAIRFAPDDIPISVRLVLDGEQARVEVRDGGPGIPLAVQTAIWERFFRAEGIEPLTAPGTGLGLGLFLCQTIIERHDGQVGVNSTPGEGATFWFTLPLAAI
jgi:signal transduction histidine kinase